MRGDPAALPAVATLIPARRDALPWGRFHLLVVIALGITWLLDGLEVTIVGALGAALQEPATLGLSPEEIGAVASFYVAGAVAGALLFGWLTDRFGRRRIFFVTLTVYVIGVALSACAWDFLSLSLFRAMTGTGIGGEYAAINSAIDELIPARLRGRVDLAVNGTYWLGAALGALATTIMLDRALIPARLGWRLGFALGALLALGVLALRRHVPESPRWLVAHGHVAAAEAAAAAIERRAGGAATPQRPPLIVHPRRSFGLASILGAMLGAYRARSLLALALMIAQAFLYNALFFTYGLVLNRFYGVAPAAAGSFLLPIASGNFLGPLLLGRLFDTVGRRRMIAGSYAGAVFLLALAGWLFALGALTVATQILAWCAVFFVASAAASAAYLTASEIFPLEARGLALSCFYAIGTGAGGVAAPWLFARLIGIGSRWEIFGGYVLAAALMLGAALVEWRIGIDAERRPLEEIAAPLATRPMER
jgi:MFS family permease